VTMTSVTTATSEMFWVAIWTSRSTANLAIYFARAVTFWIIIVRLGYGTTLSHYVSYQHSNI